ncbi:PDZ and LIM domain protein 4-like isoform X1 [Haliotis rufescens]|uniref:PDZ and LIM domain protein 4-like isoform X1 n=1 Tax=Haliotis rufescens TaxID=6454 RepID=UPI001EB05013|nr:PDZ and LIM domain protein 4-like isoform X1 [Haliotis rufescens]XP_048248469.1 PDZ and LIM domain protein 4-like isoform X1 [Haliotis rufescens]
MTYNQYAQGPTVVKIGRSISREETNTVVSLRRTTTGNPWGFRMLGGRDQGTCLYVHKVNSKSIAEKSGLKPGDGLLSIAGVPTDGMTHDQAKMEILRAGNELDFFVRRNAVSVATENIKRQQSTEEPRAEIIEEPSVFDTGYQNPNVQSRSFKILQESLNYTDAADIVTDYRSQSIPEEGLLPMQAFL